MVANYNMLHGTNPFSNINKFKGGRGGGMLFVNKYGLHVFQGECSKSSLMETVGEKLFSSEKIDNLLGLQMG